MTLNEKIKRYLWEATNTNDYAFVRGNMKLSMREIAEGYQQLQSRVKELEDKALTLGDIHEAHIIIIKQLERKLGVARDAVRNIIDGDLPNIWQFTSEIEPEVLEYINTLAESIDKLYEALTATETSTKETEG